MDIPEPHTPQRQVGAYKRLGRAGSSPAEVIGIGVVFLIIVIGLIIAPAW